MDSEGIFAAELIDSSARTVASRSVSRLLESDPAAPGNGGGSFAELVSEAEHRLLYLAEALAAGAPGLFVAHVEWLRDAHGARGVPTATLATGLELLRDELRETLPPAVGEIAARYAEQGLEAARREPAPIESPLAGGGPHVDLARRLLLALLEARRFEALELVAAAATDEGGGLGVSDLELHVITPALREMGAMWQRGELQIAEEHIGSGIVAELLALLRQRIPGPQPDARRVVVASVAGNIHDFGARIVADHFALAGWDPLLLGANTPADEVLWTVAELGADLIALSTAIGLHVRTTADLIGALERAHPALPVIVGGGPFARVPDLWRAVGADGHATDARQAVVEAERLAAAGD